MTFDSHHEGAGISDILTDSLSDKNEESVRNERHLMYAMFAGAWLLCMVLNAFYVHFFATPDLFLAATYIAAPLMVAIAYPLREPTYSRYLYLPGLWLLSGLIFYAAIYYGQAVLAMYLLLPGVFLAVFYWSDRLLTALHLVVLVGMAFAAPLLIGVTEPLRTALMMAPPFGTLMIALGYLGAHANRINVARSRFESTISSLLVALQERDGQIAEGARHVEELSIRVASRLGLGGDQMRLVIDSARLHDVGKIGIPSELLDKPAALTADEWIVMRTHPEIGERIVATVPGFDDVAIVIRHTHERWDGNGYPDRISGTAIPLASRIIFTCDAYEAMVSQRPFRSPLTDEEAVSELRRGAGTQFDPQVVKALLAVLGAEDLSSGAQGGDVVQLRPAAVA